MSGDVTSVEEDHNAGLVGPRETVIVQSSKKKRKLPKQAIVPDEPLPRAVQRISLHLLDKAISDLRPRDDQSFDAGVHSARKRVKRLRAMLRLVRDDVGYRTYREENVALRNTSRTLSAVRDAWVLVDTLGTLRGTYEDLIDDGTFRTSEAWLRAQWEEQHRTVTKQTVVNAVCSLGTARARFANYPIDSVVGNDYSAIAAGLRRVYLRGQRGMARATSTTSVEDLHEWRKRVKYLRYQMEVLTPMYPRLIKPTAKSLRDLGELLGYDHDLAVLAQTVMDNPESCRDDRERWMMVALIHERRTSTQAQAFRLGSALYVEEPSAFVDRLGAYWDAGSR